MGVLSPKGMWNVCLLLTEITPICLDGTRSRGHLKRNLVLTYLWHPSQPASQPALLPNSGSRKAYTCRNNSECMWFATSRSPSPKPNQMSIMALTDAWASLTGWFCIAPRALGNSSQCNVPALNDINTVNFRKICQCIWRRKKRLSGDVFQLRRPIGMDPYKFAVKILALYKLQSVWYRRWTDAECLS